MSPVSRRKVNQTSGALFKEKKAQFENIKQQLKEKSKMHNTSDQEAFTPLSSNDLQSNNEFNADQKGPFKERDTTTSPKLPKGMPN